jgi:hypothetical protein
MSFEELTLSVEKDAAPPEVSAALQGLWFAARGDWESAHARAQNDPSPAGSWVHAYLHREEGDLGNARYWYSRAGQKVPSADVSLKDEWAQIARSLLAS